MTDIDALQKLLDEATPGPWEANEGRLGVHSIAVTDYEIAEQVDETDAALIVAAVNALPELIRELRTFRADPHGRYPCGLPDCKVCLPE